MPTKPPPKPENEQDEHLTRFDGVTTNRKGKGPLAPGMIPHLGMTTTQGTDRDGPQEPLAATEVSPAPPVCHHPSRASLDSKVTSQSHQLCRDAMDYAFGSIKEAVEAAWISDGFILMEQNKSNSTPLDPVQSLIHQKWLSHFAVSQGLARETFLRQANGLDSALLAQYDLLQSEAKACIGQGQRMAQQAALFHLRASDKEKAARRLFEGRLPSLPKGSPVNKDSKAPERHARDLAIFTMAGIVRPQNAETFGEDCADILAPAMTTLSKDMLSQLKNATQQNVIYSDAQHVVMETLLAIKQKKRGQNTQYAEERG
jgi:hypothetical protein